MNLTEKIAVTNGILLAVSETLPLLSRDITKANSLLQLITHIFTHKHPKTKRPHNDHK